MSHSNGTDHGGHYLSGGPDAAAATTGNPAAITTMDAMQSHFGDSLHQQQQLQNPQPQGNNNNNLQINNYLQLSTYANNQQQLPQQPPPSAAPQHPHQVLQQHQQQQQFLPGPFYTLQQQQAFNQARLAAAAQVQAQQWQQQLAQVQFQAQQQQQQAQLQGASITAAQPQQNIQSFPLVGQSQNSVFEGGGMEVASQSSQHLTHPSGAPLGMQTALNYISNASEHGAEALVSPTATLLATIAPSASLIAPATATTSAPPTAVAAEPTRRRLSGTKSQLTNKATPSIHESATTTTTNGKSSSKKYPTLIASKKKPTEKYAPSSSSSGQLLQHQPPDSCVSSGISSSAAKLIQNAMDESNTFEIPSECSTTANYYGDGNNNGEPSSEQKKQSSRDRNREHARCTRLRKKAYVDKLKELVDGLHAERNEDARKRRAAVQRLAEVQELRRKVVNTFLEYHCSFESDYNKWKLIVETGGGDKKKHHGIDNQSNNAVVVEEEEFWMKQPVTPYRSFRRCEIQKGSRILRGIDALIRDSASMAVMIDTIGSRNLRWLQRKRDDFLAQYSSKRHRTDSSTAVHRALRAANNVGPTLPRSVCQNRQAQHAISSLSSCSGSSTEFGSSSEEERRLAQRQLTPGKGADDSQQVSSTAAKNVTSSSSSNDTNQQRLCNEHHSASNNDFHDYNAPSLPDPLPRSGGSSSSIADGIDSDNCVVGAKQTCTDSSSGEDEKSNNDTTAAEKQNHTKKRKVENTSGHKNITVPAYDTGSSCVTASLPSITAANANLPPNIARAGGIFHNVKVMAQSHERTAINALLPNGHANLSRAPATALPPFAGIGKRKQPPATNHQSAISANKDGTSTASEIVSSQQSRPLLASNSDSNITSGTKHHNGGNRSSSNLRYNGSSDHNIITFDYGSTASSQSLMFSNRGIEAHYHINEDDMILTDDVLMCPFIFRSREAVRYGALAECVQPGMLRACFSPTNKLRNIEMIFDAMGFCQQLERASGNEGMAHIIPNSLEMALAPNLEEARVITLAQSPFMIVYVNEPWTAITGYTQLDAEGKDLNILHRDRPTSDARIELSGEPPHEYANAANGVCTSGTYVQYDINGREILNFMCSYPLSNLKDEVTHILHVCKELPPRA